ncbi:ATP-binding protein [Streptomyces sp. PKU-MA01144]|uniref:ATP-binding protein n=1 Tax=Streptomyces sp. PKU-MA01144 TaxID=2729138 RepID=UPI000382B886|nr:ATP-binding protein [Streptomyces sp. PKU-MA01144]NNJ06203.1 ATP-binding protein [Streptomyces sp. PKU-MA01144]
MYVSRVVASISRNDDQAVAVIAHRPEAAGTARHTTKAVLDSWHVRLETADAVLMVVSELVTNAVEHARPPLMLHLHREEDDGRVCIEVTDNGPAPHDGPWTSSCAADEHGRGLAIVDALTEAHGTHGVEGGRTTHWAHLAAA